jgi:hypothetical protein
MIRLPEPKPEILARRDEIVAALRRIVPATPLAEGVIADPVRLKPYETDGLTAYRQVPLAVVLPETTEQVAAVLRSCHEMGVRVVPRGAGTSLSGGALPLADAVVIGLMRMNRVLEVDFENRLAVVEAGVTNIGITKAVEEQGFFYAPDPSSQLACMIGGNVMMNSGGAHCLKYGVTSNNLLGLNVLMSVGAFILALGQVPFILNFFLSIKGGRKTNSDNPWHCTTLEWATPTLPPHGNFDFEPVVVRGPYEYSVPGINQDYFPQWEIEPGKAAPVPAGTKASAPAHH